MRIRVEASLIRFYETLESKPSENLAKLDTQEIQCCRFVCSTWRLHLILRSILDEKSMLCRKNRSVAYLAYVSKIFSNSLIYR